MGQIVDMVILNTIKKMYLEAEYSYIANEETNINIPRLLETLEREIRQREKDLGFHRSWIDIRANNA